ncbi:MULTISPECIES: hypothetical protein [Acidithiobacillus]|uniref:hypothetical protein n=1 Tax=Acidithiobacillus TaxID=119977 RepID=UPI00384D25D6
MLDEPTNDLDLETLEVLEERLQNYTGTLFLVSHDRDFLDNVVTQVIAFGENGQLTQNAGGYEDWLRWQTEIQRAASKNAESSTGKTSGKRENSKKTTLSYKESQELVALPAQIEAMEQEQENVAATLALPGTYQNPEKLKALQLQSEQLAKKLQQTYSRWEHLEAKAAASSNA